MDTISFQNVIPNVFEEVDNLQSELWNQSQTFQKGHLYLVEATSGKGKSTFCSYLIGYRSDYQGQILFDQENISSFDGYPPACSQSPFSRIATVP